MRVQHDLKTGHTSEYTNLSMKWTMWASSSFLAVRMESNELYMEHLECDDIKNDTKTHIGYLSISTSIKESRGYNSHSNASIQMLLSVFFQHILGACMHAFTIQMNVSCLHVTVISMDIVFSWIRLHAHIHLNVKKILKPFIVVKITSLLKKRRKRKTIRKVARTLGTVIMKRTTQSIFEDGEVQKNINCTCAIRIVHNAVERQRKRK